MRSYSKEECCKSKDILKTELKEKHPIFVYPTDTIYGIGCNATDQQAVDQVRAAKQRPENPFSIIVPSKQWIIDHCEVPEKHQSWIDKLPGPYTFILKLKTSVIAPSVNSGKETVGVRIPDHWISELVGFYNVPIVSTSANLAGQDFMTTAEDLAPEIKGVLDYMIYEGPKNGTPSQIVDLTQDEATILR